MWLLTLKLDPWVWNWHAPTMLEILSKQKNVQLPWQKYRKKSIAMQKYMVKPQENMSIHLVAMMMIFSLLEKGKFSFIPDVSNYAGFPRKKWYFFITMALWPMIFYHLIFSPYLLRPNFSYKTMFEKMYSMLNLPLKHSNGLALPNIWTSWTSPLSF